MGWSAAERYQWRRHYACHVSPDRDIHWHCYGVNQGHLAMSAGLSPGLFSLCLPNGVTHYCVAPLEVVGKRNQHLLHYPHKKRTTTRTERTNSCEREPQALWMSICLVCDRYIDILHHSSHSRFVSSPLGSANLARGTVTNIPGTVQRRTVIGELPQMLLLSRRFATLELRC
jgi:hypothetical protein